MNVSFSKFRRKLYGLSIGNVPPYTTSTIFFAGRLEYRGFGAGDKRCRYTLALSWCEPDLFFFTLRRIRTSYLSWYLSNIGLWEVATSYLSWYLSNIGLREASKHWWLSGTSSLLPCLCLSNRGSCLWLPTWDLSKTGSLYDSLQFVWYWSNTRLLSSGFWEILG